MVDEPAESCDRGPTPSAGCADGTDPGDHHRHSRSCCEPFSTCTSGGFPHAVADEEAAKYRGDRLGALRFAWAGGLEPGEGHYYRVQGPRLLVEYDNTQRGANHIHSVWRDPDADFGDDLLRAHRARGALG